MKRQQIIVDNNTYEVIATTYDDITNKNYCIYTDLNNKTELKLSCVIYYEENDKFIPVKITDAKEKEFAVSFIKEVMQNISRIVR